MGTLYETSDASAGDVLTVGHAVITKAGFVPTLLLTQVYSLKDVSYSEWM
jgi:hypothetical protein